jgi:hypothetical protein
MLFPVCMQVIILDLIVLDGDTNYYFSDFELYAISLFVYYPL